LTSAPNESVNRLIKSIGEFSFQVKLIIIVIGAIAIFYPDLYTIGSEALASDYFNYVLVLPFLIFFLIYRKRRMLSAMITQRDDNGRGYVNLTIGISALAISLVFYLYGTFTSDPLDYHLIAFQIFLGASVLMLFNRQTLKFLAFPILLITAALPAVVQFGLGWWQDFSYASATYAYDVLATVHFPVVLGTVIDVPAIQLTRANGDVMSFILGVASSGIYSVVGFSVFAAFVAFIARGPVWKKVFLFALGFPLLLVINIFRVDILVLAAYYWGVVAFDIFHATTGIVLVFIVTFVLLVLGERAFHLRFFDIRTTSKYCSYCQQEWKNGKSFCTNCGKFLRICKVNLSRRDLIPIVALLLITIIFLSSLVPAVVTANSPTTVNLDSITHQNVLSFLPNIPQWNLSFVYRDTVVEEVLDQDAALIYTYTSTNAPLNPDSGPPQFMVTVQISAGIHTPEDSIIVAPSFAGLSKNTIYKDQDAQILSNPVLVGKYFAYQPFNTTYTQTVLYWNIGAAFNIGNYYDFRNVQIGIWSVTQDLASQGVIKSASDLQAAESAAMSIAVHVANYWEPLSSNSLLQTTVRKMYFPLLGLALFPAVVITGNSANTRKKESKASRKTFENVKSTHDKDLLKSVDASKGRDQTLEIILIQYKKLSGAEMSFADASVALASAERLGLIRHHIIEIYNEPVMVWKPMFHSNQ